MRPWTTAFALALLAGSVAGQTPTSLMPLPFENSAEFRWLGKPVLDRRVLDDASSTATWRFSGTGTFRVLPRTLIEPVTLGAHMLRVDLQMFVDSPAPTRTRLSSVNLVRPVANEDWSAFNRVVLWIRPDISGFPMLPLQLVLHNEGRVRIPDSYDREGTHFITLRNGVWQQVLWEIPHLPRDRVTSVEIGYWVNKMLASPGDRVAFEIGGIELQRVAPDHFEGWNVQAGSLAYSHSGYRPSLSKSALGSDVRTSEFTLVRLDGAGLPEIVFRGPVQTMRTRTGTHQLLDFSAVQQPGRYVVQAGELRSREFAIGEDAWRPSIEKALNFFFGERCGIEVPGSHGVCHTDWTTTHDGARISMNGGWHDAGDLSQSAVNTAEATYGMFALAEQLARTHADTVLLERVLDEADWGLDWLLRVRFPGGFRPYFASNNLWTDGKLGTADDRTREAKNNPTVNYAAATAEAIAARVLKTRDPELAARSLKTAEEDWGYANEGHEGADTRDTPAFAATRMELAAMGVLASAELYRATSKPEYAAKAAELADIVVQSQQQRFIGSTLPLSGFFYTGPDRDTLFHQFHRGNDQAPVTALAALVELFPDHPDWMKWYAAIARYAEYQKTTARATEPYGVLPAYVFRDDEYLQLPDTVGMHRATRAAFRAQVLTGLPLGDGWYLRNFPVWFARRGNFGVLLSQAKALSTTALLRRDSAAYELAQRQAQWVVGRNPFSQSTMIGEGYDWAQQYSVSSGDFVGALPVGMETRGEADAPYWPGQNMYVYKEVWVHPVARWLWLMQDLAYATSPAASPALDWTLASETRPNGDVVLRVTGANAHSFALRTSNLSGATKTKSGRSVEWKLKLADAGAPWVAVVIADGDVAHRRDAFGALPRYAWPSASELATPRSIGYLSSGAPLRNGFKVSDLAGDRLTHIFYAFGRMGEGGVAALGNPCVDIGECGANPRPAEIADGGNIEQLRLLKQRYPHLRVLVSLGGWGGSQYFSDAAVDAVSRERAVRSTLDVFLRAHPDVFDGVDVDWEYPVRGGPRDNHVRPEDKHNYTLLMQEYRRQLDELSRETGKRYELSIAVSAGARGLQSFEPLELARTLDWINVMTYDYHVGDTIAHFNSPLRAVKKDPSPDNNIEQSLQRFVDAGVPRHQLVVGAPFYARGYGSVAARNHGLLQVTKEAAPQPWRELSYRQLATGEWSGAGFRRYWSDAAQAPWLYNEELKTLITYDDPQSIEAKARFVREQKYGGLMFWQLGQDDGTLLEAVARGLTSASNAHAQRD